MFYDSLVCVLYDAIKYNDKRKWNKRRWDKCVKKEMQNEHNTCDGWLAALQEADSWTTGQSPRCQTARKLPVPLHCTLRTKQSQ